MEQVTRYSRPVLELCQFALLSRDNPNFPCRDFLNHLHTESARLEELVDHYGAQTNEVWFAFRETIAAAKLFSNLTYSVVHIRSALSRYRLLGIDGDCAGKTGSVITMLRDAIVNISNSIIEQAHYCEIETYDVETGFSPCEEEPVVFRLPADRSVRHVAKVGEIVVYLATRFLNLSEDRNVRDVLIEAEDDRYSACVPDPISEELVRAVETRFHNLQSLYDTYIFESDIEQQNEKLLYLRGHVSMIYHLLSTATDLVHYYTRHMSSLRRDTVKMIRFPMQPETILELLFEYPLRYSRYYMESAVHLCQTMIQSYSEQTVIVVPIPRYRGFHVRPSMLVSRIVAHYGSTVSVFLNNHRYNAASPLDLFRANEEINALKRRQIADMLSRKPELQVPVPADPSECRHELQLIFMRLIHADEIVLYDTDLDFEGIDTAVEATMAELTVRYIRHFVSIAKMDIRSTITIRFEGDNRALNDLEILANHGYGEDHMGNNTVLPAELSYLSR